MNILLVLVLGISFVLPDVQCRAQGEAAKPARPPYDMYQINANLVKGNVTSYSGFLNGSGDSKMFAWFFPSETLKADSLILWLQGDIGTSSLKGLYENNGPFYPKISKGSGLRKHYWSQKSNVLYLDTSVGSGFSHSPKKVYPTNMNQVVENLYASLNNFFTKFPHLKSNRLYLAGDGFACVTITQLAKKIDRTKAFNLKGLILENGFCDPISGVSVADHFDSLKMIDDLRKTKLLGVERDILNLIKTNKHAAAFDLFDTYIKGLLTPYKTLFKNATHFDSSRDLRHSSDKERLIKDFKIFVTTDNIKYSMNVPKELPYDEGKTVLNNLRGDLMRSSLQDLGQLLNKYSVLMYYGQDNPEMSPRGAYSTGSSVKWCGGEYFGDVYKPWFVGDNLAGYLAVVETSGCTGSLTWALVRNAGKDIAHNNPAEIVDLIEKFKKM